MKRWRTSLLLAGAALVFALPAFSQRSPESLLPPGFNDPATVPAPAPAAPSSVDEAPRAPQTQVDPARPARPATLPGLEGVAVEDASDADLADMLGLELPVPDDLPDWARRSPVNVGPLGPDNGGLDETAFGRAHGAFLNALVAHLDAPLPSRWTSIVMRRALLSHIPAPYGVSPVDWVAERAALLLRMGEADGARMLVQAVDVDRFTPRMFDVALESAMANADPAGLCPLVAPGRKVSDRPVWPLAEAICAALEGEASRASALIDQQRRQFNPGDLDYLVAAKVVGAGQNTGRAVTIEWDPVDRIDSWHFGLLSATGLSIPDRLLDGAGASMRAWQARAPMVPLEQRLASSDVAASLGVFSSRSLIELYSLVADTTDPSEMRDSVADRLNQAFAGSADARMAAMRALWQVESPVQRHARLILTAAAAARVAPSEDFAADAPSLIASMLTAGFDREAARWAAVVADLDGVDADRAWALLALGAPRPVVEISAGRIGDFAGRDESVDTVRTRLLVAALAGLGRIPESDIGDIASDYGVRLDRRNKWMGMIDSAAERGQPATVALLAGVGMQTADWRGVPPEHLFHILRALRRVGLDYEARMIGAEALTRL
jgi:hypothetical protein